MTFPSCLLPSNFFFDEICGFYNYFFQSVNEKLFSLSKKDEVDF